MSKQLENKNSQHFMYKTRALQLFTKHCYITDKLVRKKRKKNSVEKVHEKKESIFILKHRSALLRLLVVFRSHLCVALSLFPLQMYIVIV